MRRPYNWASPYFACWEHINFHDVVQRQEQIVILLTSGSQWRVTFSFWYFQAGTGKMYRYMDVSICGFIGILIMIYSLNYLIFSVLITKGSDNLTKINKGHPTSDYLHTAEYSQLTSQTLCFLRSSPFKEIAGSLSCCQDPGIYPILISWLNSVHAHILFL